MVAPYNPIYTVGDGTRTQLAKRADGVWFIRVKWRGVWGRWESQPANLYEFSRYIDKRAGSARLPDE